MQYSGEGDSRNWPFKPLLSVAISGSTDGKWNCLFKPLLSVAISGSTDGKWNWRFQCSSPLFHGSLLFFLFQTRVPHGGQYTLHVACIHHMDRNTLLIHLGGGGGGGV